jgi:hypothetical protein
MMNIARRNVAIVLSTIEAMGAMALRTLTRGKPFVRVKANLLRAASSKLSIISQNDIDFGAMSLEVLQQLFA